MKHQGRDLGQILIEEGLVPGNARMLDLVVTSTDAVIIRYEVYVHTDDLYKIARALTRLAARDTSAELPFRDTDRPAGGDKQ